MAEFIIRVDTESEEETDENESSSDGTTSEDSSVED